MLFLKLRLFRRCQSPEESLGILLGDAALILGRRVPDKRGLRLNDPGDGVVAPAERNWRGKGNAYCECRAFEESTFHRECNLVADPTIDGKRGFRLQITQ